jgi:hypothetical protein
MKISKIDSSSADRLVQGNWFQDNTKEVTLVEDQTEFNSFDGERRGDNNKGPEFIIFKGDIQIKGDVRVGDYHSVYVFLGNLEANSFENGDAVFIVSGQLKLKNYFLKLQSDGIFMDGHTDWDDQDDENPGPRAIQAPILFWHNPLKRHTYLYKDGKKIAKDTNEMAAYLKPEFFKKDMDELFLVKDKLKNALRKNEIIFK